MDDDTEMTESSQQSEEGSLQSHDRSEVIASGTFNQEEEQPQLTQDEIDRTYRLLRKRELLEKKRIRAERRSAAKAQQQTQNEAVKQETLIDLTCVKKEEAKTQLPMEPILQMWHCLHIECKRYFSTPERHG